MPELRGPGGGGGSGSTTGPTLTIGYNNSTYHMLTTEAHSRGELNYYCLTMGIGTWQIYIIFFSSDWPRDWYLQIPGPDSLHRASTKSFFFTIKMVT